LHQAASIESPPAVPKTISTWHWNILARFWYPLLTYLTRNESVIFLNYGYCGDAGTGNAPALEETDEPDRSCIQLYDHVAGAVDLRGRDVLEISCGHGGGASYIARYLKPKSIRGVDRNPEAIKLCKRRHRAEGLSFSCGNATSLDFANDTFDAVVNIEASHCYPDMMRFLSEVRRVLRPGGYFLYADFRYNNPGRDIVHNQVQQSGLEVITEENISPGVVRGMQLNSEKYSRLIQQLVPKPLIKHAKSFAGLKGSPVYMELASGETIYFRYVLRKPASD